MCTYPAEAEQHGDVRIWLEPMKIRPDTLRVGKAGLPFYDALEQARGNMAFLGGLPVRRIHPLAAIIMQYEKLINAIYAASYQPVIAVPKSLVPALIWEMLNQLLHRMLNKEYAGGLQRLNEPAGKADGNTITDPRIPAAPDPHFNMVSFEVAGGRADELAKRPFSIFRITEFARINIANAVSAKQRYNPDPASILSDGPGIGSNSITFSIDGYAKRNSAIVGQGLLERDKWFTKCLIQQNATETSAVYEQVAVQFAIVFGNNFANPATLVRLDMNDVINDTPYSLPGAESRKEPAEQRRIKVVGVRKLRELFR
jgi:hypothetical protein